MRVLFAALLALCLLPVAARADQQWLVVSDLHVDPFDRSLGPSLYGTDTNWALFESTVAEMRDTQPKPQLVVIAGDFLTHHFEAKARAANPHQSTADAARAAMKRIEQTFARAFPDSQFLIVLGNNDDPCGDYVTAPDTAYMRDVAQMWAPLVNRNGAAPDFLKAFSHAGYYTAKLPGSHLRAVALDDVYWSIVYRSCGRGGAPESQLAWLGRTLRATPAGTRNVILMHIPPGTDPVSTLATHRFLIVPFLRDGVQKAFLADAQTNAQRISFAIAGHLHEHDFRVLGNIPVLMAPSVSPIYSNNPGFLRLYVGSDGTLKNYQLYAYDAWISEWSRIFDFDRAYGVTAFDVPSLLGVHRRIGDDPGLRDQWASAVLAGSASQRVNRRNWRAYWCAQAAAGSAYSQCAGDQRRTAVAPIAVLLIGAIVLVALGGLFVRLASQRARRRV